ncbi:histone-lysine N-methyltransferase SETMAR [Trichonephila clavipes]|nr:histone-lysine N-methyltransferase SETMAR [Trichonephila clavipes]
MFKLIELPTKCGIRSVIRFLTARNTSAADIHRQITEVYGTEAMKERKIRKWVRKFIKMGEQTFLAKNGIKATVDGMATHILSRQGTTINSDAYCPTLRKLRRALKNKQHGMLSKGGLLLHDNASPHISRTTQELIESFGWEVLDHAPYNPDLAPRDFHLFRYLKHSLGGKRFSNNEEVKAAVNSLLSDQVADFFEEGFQNLILR